MAEQSRSFAARLVAEGKHAEAMPYLAHALHQQPGNLQLIGEHLEARLALIEGADGIEDHLVQLEAFLRSRIVHVSSEEIATVIQVIRELPARVSARIGETAPAPREPLEVPDVLSSDWDAERFAARAEERLDEQTKSGKLGEAARTRDLIATASASDAVRRAREEAQRLVSASRQQAPTVAAYFLQAAEGALRPAALGLATADPRLAPLVLESLEELRRTSEALAATTRNADGEGAWEKLRLAEGQRIVAVESWTALLSGSCQQVLDEVRLLMQAAQRIQPSVAQSSAEPKFLEFVARISELATQIATEQQRRYCVWAMATLETGFEKGLKHIGVIDDEPELDDAMAETFGPIDVRLLTFEVQRCYSEIFEHLFQRLDRPDSKEDFGKRGTKLHLLKRILEWKKKTVAEF